MMLIQGATRGTLAGLALNQQIKDAKDSAVPRNSHMTYHLLRNRAVFSFSHPDYPA